MSLWTLLGIILVLSLAGFYFGRARAAVLTGGRTDVLHSRPQFYGVYVAMICGLPALGFFLIWLAFDETIIRALVLASLPPEEIELDAGRLSLLMSQIQSVAGGRIFGDPIKSLR